MNSNDNKSNCHDELCELAYDSISASLVQQQADLRAIRNQASIVAAVSGLIATFLSRFILQNFELVGKHPSSIWPPVFIGINLPFLIALVCFLGSVAFSFLILLPSGGWKFETSPSRILKKFGNRGNGFGKFDAFFELAKIKEGFFTSNEKLLIRVQNKLVWASVLAIAQVPAWLITFMEF